MRKNTQSKTARRVLVSDSAVETYEKIVQLKFIAADGENYACDCANTETMFRITRRHTEADALVRPGHL